MISLLFQKIELFSTLLQNGSNKIWTWAPAGGWGGYLGEEYFAPPMESQSSIEIGAKNSSLC